MFLWFLDSTRVESTHSYSTKTLRFRSVAFFSSVLWVSFPTASARLEGRFEISQLPQIIDVAHTAVFGLSVHMYVEYETSIIMFLTFEAKDGVACSTRVRHNQTHGGRALLERANACYM